MSHLPGARAMRVVCEGLPPHQNGIVRGAVAIQQPLAVRQNKTSKIEGITFHSRFLLALLFPDSALLTKHPAMSCACPKQCDCLFGLPLQRTSFEAYRYDLYLPKAQDSIA